VNFGNYVSRSVGFCPGFENNLMVLYL